MLDGWYCRSMANQSAAQNNEEEDNEPNVVDDSDDESDTPVAQLMPRVDYKAQYNTLKKKLKFLLYENEYFQDALRSSQRRLLKVMRDRSYLLDRLLEYEKPEVSSSDSDATESSEDESGRVENVKKRKADTMNASQSKSANPPKRRKTSQKKAATATEPTSINNAAVEALMTAEEVERHLQSRQSFCHDIVTEATETVPNEMFSNEPSLDSESNDHLVETSPSNLGEDVGSISI